MDIVLIIVIVLIVAVWLWLNTLALLCLFLDPDLAPIQRWGQSVFILLVPFLGASFALLLIKSHSPEVVAKFYIPWPFSRLIDDKPSRSRSVHNHHEDAGSHNASSFREANNSTDSGGE